MVLGLHFIGFFNAMKAMHCLHGVDTFPVIQGDNFFTIFLKLFQKEFLHTLCFIFVMFSQRLEEKEEWVEFDQASLQADQKSSY